eukprot:COSAG01_NODE_338_length_18671_cov_259.238154_28_plen_198_part_00
MKSASASDAVRITLPRVIDMLAKEHLDHLRRRLSASPTPSADNAVGNGGVRMADVASTRGNFPLCDGSAQLGTGVGGSRWYRFISTHADNQLAALSGDALPLSPLTGNSHCGTIHPIWLTGWKGDSRPPEHYDRPGRYPAPVEGVIQMQACIQNGRSYCEPMWGSLHVSVVQCDGFFLWQLPYAVCDSAYCTTASGL